MSIFIRNSAKALGVSFITTSISWFATNNLSQAYNKPQCFLAFVLLNAALNIGAGAVLKHKELPLIEEDRLKLILGSSILQSVIMFGITYPLKSKISNDLIYNLASLAILLTTNFFFTASINSKDLALSK